MSRYKPIPIKAAREISRAFEKDQVIIIAWDKRHGKSHVTTYGKTFDDCQQAALGGNMIKRSLGWPEELCNALPARVRRKKAKANG